MSNMECQRFFAFSKRVPKDVKRFCGICRQHGKLEETRGHICEFKDCECQKCYLVRSRRLVMSQQIRLRRAQDKRFQRTDQPEKADVIPLLTPRNQTQPFEDSLLETNLNAAKGASANDCDDGDGSDDSFDQKQQQLIDAANAKNMCYFCQKCKNHGMLVWKKQHKRQCPFTDCTCDFCELIETRRRLDQHMKLRKSEMAQRKNDKISGTSNANSETEYDKVDEPPRKKLISSLSLTDNHEESIANGVEMPKTSLSSNVSLGVTDTDITSLPAHLPISQHSLVPTQQCLLHHLLLNSIAAQNNSFQRMQQNFSIPISAVTTGTMDQINMSCNVNGPFPSPNQQIQAERGSIDFISNLLSGCFNKGTTTTAPVSEFSRQTLSVIELSKININENHLQKKLLQIISKVLHDKQQIEQAIFSEAIVTAAQQQVFLNNNFLIYENDKNSPHHNFRMKNPITPQEFDTTRFPYNATVRQEISSEETAPSTVVIENQGNNVITDDNQQIYEERQKQKDQTASIF